MIRKGNKHNVWANGNTITLYCTTLFPFPFLILLSFLVPGCMDFGYENHHQFNAILL